MPKLLRPLPRRDKCCNFWIYGSLGLPFRALNPMNIDKHYIISVGIRLLAGIMLLLGLGYREYSYYILLRWVVTASAIYSGWIASHLKIHYWTWFFFIVAIIFNPIIPLHMSKSTWQILDLVFAIGFFVSIIKLKRVRVDEAKH